MKGGTSQNLSSFYFHNSWIYVEIMTQNVNFPIGPVHYLACQNTQRMHKVHMGYSNTHFTNTLIDVLFILYVLFCFLTISYNKFALFWTKYTDIIIKRCLVTPRLMTSWWWECFYILIKHSIKSIEYCLIFSFGTRIEQKHFCNTLVRFNKNSLIWAQFHRVAITRKCC